jgi:hypothetical protein
VAPYFRFLSGTGSFQQQFYFPGEHREVCFDNAPDHIVRDDRVPVDQLVSEGNDPGGAADFCGKSRIVPECLVQCFANDLELAFDTGPEKRIVFVIRKFFAGNELADQIACFSDIEKIFPGVMRLI